VIHDADLPGAARSSDGLRIAIVGSRGIPARYSGFETYVEQLAPRLVESGHEVTVYCRRGYTGEEQPAAYRGVRLVYTPYLRQRELETLSHELVSIVDSLRRKVDLYFFLGTRSSPMYVPLRLTRRVVVVQTDGLEWKRRKWNALGRRYLRLAEAVAARFAADELVTDAHAMRDYFLDRYGRDSVYLTYGAPVLTACNERILGEHGLEPGGYYLVVARIEPENNVDWVLREFRSSGSARQLVVVGGMNYPTSYWDLVQRLAAGTRIRLLGPVYGDDLLDHLFVGAYAYVHGHEVGGTNPSLLQAMGAGRCVLALDTRFNAENLDGTGLSWEKRRGSLAERIRWADAHPDDVRQLGERARSRIAEHYSWERIAEAHDAFFREVARRHGIPAHAAGSAWA
jgi:glycosyltransferase involved in cell wall biosynthesis